MKQKLLLLSTVLFIQTMFFGQQATNPLNLPLLESFIYPIGGNLNGQGFWTNATTSSVDESIVSTPVLNYTGLPLSTGVII